MRRGLELGHLVQSKQIPIILARQRLVEPASQGALIEVALFDFGEHKAERLGLLAGIDNEFAGSRIFV